MSTDLVSDGGNEPLKNRSNNEKDTSVDEGYQPLKKGHRESVEHGLVEHGYESSNNERRIEEQSLVNESYQPLSRSRRGAEEADEQEELSYVDVVD